MPVNYDPERVATAFQRLFQTYPSFQAAEADDTLRVYFEAVGPYETTDIETAVDNFLVGSAPGHGNPNFAPPAPVIAAEVRRVLTRRLDVERLTRRALPAPEPVIGEAERARVAQGLRDLASSLGAGSEREEAERAARRREDSEAEIRHRVETGEFISRPGATYPISRTLAKKLGIGDPDGDREVA